MMNKLLAFSVFLLVLALAAFGFNTIYLSAPGTSSNSVNFVVPENPVNFNVAEELKSENLIKNEKSFKFLLEWLSGIGSVSPGGYNLAQNMNAWQVLRKISGKPDSLWVTTSHCLRKEQIAEIVGGDLGWDNSKIAGFDYAIADSTNDYYEGVYYPDTYLIPVSDSGASVAMRFVDNFNQKLTLLSGEMVTKNIQWTTALKIASLIEREAAGPSDMRLISGIIWNRLNKNMPLQIDATLAYTLGKNINGSWWRTIDVAQKKSDSPYNSYKFKGLPPTPICSPDTDAIEAAINPETTDCLFYLHDGDKQIHCAATYTEHLANIKKYLE